MPMGTPSMELLSAETLEMLQKAAGTGIGLNTSLGAYGVDLSGLTSLVPVNTPARNNTSAFPREIAGMGSNVALWRTWLNINSQQYSGNVGTDYAGSPTLFQEQDVYAPYLPIAKFGRATLDAVAFARNYIDAVAQAELQTLNQVFICQDMNIINSQNWKLLASGAPAVPTGTPSTTGGSLAAGSSYYVAYTIRSGANYFDGGSTLGSAIAGPFTTTGSTGSIAMSITGGAATVPGGVAYDWYFGVSNTPGSMYYYGTTTVANVTLTVLPTAAPTSVAAARGYTAAVGPLSVPPLMSALLPGHGVNPIPNNTTTGANTAGNGTLPTAGVGDSDLSGNANYYNGLLASTLGWYSSTGPVTPGTGGATTTGSTFIDWQGGSITNTQGTTTVATSASAIPALDQVNQTLWQNVQLSPTAYMMNSLQAQAISNALRGSTAATTFLPPTDADARTNLAAGGFVGRYINVAAGGTTVNIEVHPRIPPGTIYVRTDRVPFPASNIGSVFSLRCQYDTMRFDYAANWSPAVSGGGPRYDFEIRSMETLVNTAPVAQGIITNCF